MSDKPEPTVTTRMAFLAEDNELPLPVTESTRIRPSAPLEERPTEAATKRTQEALRRTLRAAVIAEAAEPRLNLLAAVRFALRQGGGDLARYAWATFSTPGKPRIHAHVAAQL